MICEVLKILCKIKVSYKLVEPCFFGLRHIIYIFDNKYKKVVQLFGDTIIITIFATNVCNKYNELYGYLNYKEA